MSLTFIHEFQNRLYRLLSDDQEISSSVKKIYFGAVQDGISPCLLITVIQADDHSRHMESIYSVEFQISAYAKDHHYQLLTKLADRIITLFDKPQKTFSDYMIAGIKANNLQFEKAKDLVLNKLIINCRALIKKEACNEFS
ncbi:MAG: hypothetical protein P8P83_00785 [Rickettsiaceae bacterium]|nr:hypothetical protein [Rickettsiaceae bacterium]